MIRHGERLDNVDYGWAARAKRPYDPPITKEGVKQARKVGEKLKGKVG